MIAQFISKFWRDQQGVTVIEFAFVAPIALLLIMGTLELGYQQYASAILNGAMDEAGRNSGLESGPAALEAIDDKVRETVRNVVPSAQFKFERRAYSDFRSVNRPEPFEDSKVVNGTRDPGECFVDLNGNGVWDALRGKDGQGGAAQVVQYRTTVTYPRLLPLYNWLGWGNDVTLVSSTTLVNQPYGRPSSSSAGVTLCTA